MSSRYMLLLVLLGAFTTLPPQQQQDICILPPPTPMLGTIAQAIYQALSKATALPADVCFVATNVTDMGGGRWIVSIAGIATDVLASNWSVQDSATWFSMVAINESITGEITSALQGQPGWDDMIATMPIPPDTKEAWIGGITSPSMDVGASAPSGGINGGGYFPFASGTSVLYGTRGVHSHGSGMRAVDFVSWAGTGMAPNAVYAASSGAVTSICRDNTQMGLRIGQYYYLHLINNPSINEGQFFSLHQYIGSMVVGSFNDRCGWADQRDVSYHLHFAFVPSSNGTIRIENWTLDTRSGTWTYGNGTTRNPGDILGPADWQGVNPPPPPNIGTPTPGPTPTGWPPGGNPPGGLPGSGTPGTTNGTNFWDFIVGGITELTRNTSRQFPLSKELQLADMVTEYAVLPLKILYITSVFNFKLAFILVTIIMFLEIVRTVYGIYMLVKRAIPFVG